jgi:adenosylcobinamide-phosphate synthase
MSHSQVLLSPMLVTSGLTAALPVATLILAAFWDYLIGDPVTWLHPVQVMGYVIQLYCRAVFALGKLWPLPASLKAGLETLAGIGLSVFLVGGSGVLGWGICQAAHWLHWGVGLVTAVVLLASCFAGRSLRDAAQDVLTRLQTEDLDTARRHLARYVGRDTANLDSPEILRAVLETVTENAIDGVFAPLFYALLGLCLPGNPIHRICLAVGLGLAYKAASTLDSCVGYRTAPYTHLGWFPARSEDVLTWFPCRLSVLCLALLSGHPWQVLQLCRRDAPQDPSPNSGWSIGVYAAILGVQLGGLNYYNGEPRLKPLLGEPIEGLSSIKVTEALTLTRKLVLFWIGLATLGLLFTGSLAEIL